MALIDSLNDFRNSIVQAKSFIAIAFMMDTAGNYLLVPTQRDFIADSAFMKIFIAWESFLESATIRYMLGEQSISGTPVTRYVQPLDQAHAHKMLIGTQKYVDWANPEIVRKLCNIFFDPLSNPFNTFISSINSDLIDLKTIRNAAAHLSSTTSAQLNSVAGRILRRVVLNTTVSQLIFSIVPASPARQTVLDMFLSKLDIAASGIANN